MVDTLQMTRSLGSYADVLADAGIVLEDVRDEARGIEIAYATDDSRRVVPRTLFVCKGAAFRREYLLQALAAGAVAYVSEVDYEVDGEVGHEVPRVLVNDIRAALGLLADAAYEHPSGRVKVRLHGHQGQDHERILPALDSVRACTRDGASRSGPADGSRVR